MDSQAALSQLPTEILISIFDLLPARSLLPVVAVNRRFYSVIVRILRRRLLRAASLPGHRVILECYHPSAKLSTPYLFCDYLSTDGLGDTEDNDDAGAAHGLPRPTLGDLHRSYSHFRPVVQDENRRARRRYPRWMDNDLPQEQPSHDVSLDENELFSQLCTVTNLVKVGPKPDLFLSHVNISEGVIRVWRDWLDAQAAAPPTQAAPILWADREQHVGVRFRVTEKESGGWEQVAVLISTDDDMPVAYRLEFDELVVRTSQLLLMMETSEDQEATTSGKAIVIAI